MFNFHFFSEIYTQVKMAAEARRKMVLDSQAEVVEGEVVWPSPLRSRLDHFNQYGVGMRLYFDFLLVAGFMLAFLGLAGVPMSLLCFSGRNPRIESFIARFSIGNLGDCGEKGEFCDLPEDMADRNMAGFFQS